MVEDACAVILVKYNKIAKKIKNVHNHYSFGSTKKSE